MGVKRNFAGPVSSPIGKKTMQQIVEVHYPGIKKELLAAAMQPLSG